MRKYEDSISSATNGLPVYNAQVRVYLQNTDGTKGSAAQLYSDAGITPLSQPVLTNGLGFYSFFIADGTYWLTTSNPDGSNTVNFPSTEIYSDARNLSVPEGETGLVIPSIGSRAGNALAFGPDGSAIAIPASTFDITAEMQALHDETEGYRDSALASKNAANADVVLTHADVVLTHADAASTSANASTAATAAIAAAISAATIGVYPSTAATYVPQGAMLTNVVAGTGGTNATNVLATWTSGTLTYNPTVYYDIVGGIIGNVRTLFRGLYIGTGTPTMPTISNSGLSTNSITLTAGVLYQNGEGYWVQSGDGLQLNRYYNNAGTPAADSTVGSLPTAAYLANVKAGAIQASDPVIFTPTDWPKAVIHEAGYPFDRVNVGKNGYVSLFNGGGKLKRPGSTHNLVFLGDSQFGLGADLANGGFSLPWRTVIALEALGIIADVTIIGIQGQGWNYTYSGAPGLPNLVGWGTAVDALYDSTKINRCICFGGSNDLWLGGRTGAQTYTDFCTFADARTTASTFTGKKLMSLTMAPRQNNEHESDRVIFNNSSAADVGARGYQFVDYRTNANIGVVNAQSNTTYFAPDKTHFIDAGRQLAATLTVAKDFSA